MQGPDSEAIRNGANLLGEASTKLGSQVPALGPILSLNAHKHMVWGTCPLNTLSGCPG